MANSRNKSERSIVYTILLALRAREIVKSAIYKRAGAWYTEWEAMEGCLYK